MDINIVWHGIQFFIFACLGVLFVHTVFGGQCRLSGAVLGAGFIISLCVLSLITCLFLTPLSPYAKWAPVGAALELAYIIAMYKFYINKKVALLLSVIFILANIQNNSFYLARATRDFGVLPAIPSYADADLLILAAVYGIVFFCTIFLFLAKYYKRIVDDDIVLQGNHLFLLLPFLCYASTCILAIGLKKSFSGIGRDMLLPFLLLNVFNFSACYAVLKSVVDNYDAAVEREKLYAAGIQLSMWETQYESLKAKIDTDTRARHDWRQHIIAIMGFTEKGDMERLESYLTDYKEKYLCSENQFICDIPPLNMLFQYYQGKAGEQGISLVIDKVLFGDCTVTAPELIVLFGNILENAMEACGRVEVKDKFIRLEIKKEKNKIILMCENSFDGKLNRKNDKIVSRKKSGGIGIASIEGIVKKYGGQLKIECNQNRFRLWAFMENIDRIKEC